MICASFNIFINVSRHIQKEPFYGQIVEVPGYKSPKIFNVTITLPHGREVPVQRAIATRK